MVHSHTSIHYFYDSWDQEYDKRLTGGQVVECSGTESIKEKESMIGRTSYAGSNEILFTCGWIRKQRELYAHIQCVFSFLPLSIFLAITQQYGATHLQDRSLLPI